MLLGTLVASLLGHSLTGNRVMRATEGTFRAGQDILNPPHLLTNFKMQRYY